jgi:hypothetical protein
MPYSEFRYYSPLHDCEMCRVSMSDARGSEYFALVPAKDGKGWRKAREETLDAIGDAIEAKKEPGQVHVSL